MSHHTIEAADHSEQIDNANHDSRSHNFTKFIGVTIALIGVLIVLTGDLESTQKDDFIRTMIDQSRVHSNYAGYSVKYRMIMMEMEKARMAISTTSGGGIADPKKLPIELNRLLGLYSYYSKERKLAREWSESFDALITAHFDAASDYSVAVLLAEVGIVLASLGILFSSRLAWLASIVIAVLCIVQASVTWVHSTKMIHSATAGVTKSEAAFKDLRKDHLETYEDEMTVDALDPGGKIRASHH
jgi:hypothetical protein